MNATRLLLSHELVFRHTVCGTCGTCGAVIIDHDITIRWVTMFLIYTPRAFSVILMRPVGCGDVWNTPRPQTGG